MERSWTRGRRKDAIRACHDWLAARGYFDGPEVPEVPEEPEGGD